jgi:hypothetical protein
MWGGGGVAGPQPMSANGAQINFGDLTQYLVYGGNNLLFLRCSLSANVQYMTDTTLLMGEVGGSCGFYSVFLSKN